jgi:hypothetical protein
MWCFWKSKKSAYAPVPIEPSKPIAAPSAPRGPRGPGFIKLTQEEKKVRFDILFDLVSPALPDGRNPSFLIRSSRVDHVDLETACFKDLHNNWIVLTSISDLGEYPGDPTEFPNKHCKVLRPRVFKESQIQQLKPWAQNWETPKTFNDIMAYIESLGCCELTEIVDDGNKYTEYKKYYDKLKSYLAVCKELTEGIYFMPTEKLKKLVATC